MDSKVGKTVFSEGELYDGFYDCSFLSSVGLMKSSEDKEAGDSEEAGAAASQPNTNSTEHTEDLEEARCGNLNNFL